jgi:hypothetical protein
MSELAGTFWQAYLVNFIFWIGMAQGAVILVATLDITGSRRADIYRPIARSFASFLPLSIFLFFALLVLGRNHIFPWIEEPIPEKAVYLNVPFLSLRGLVGLGLLTWLSFKSLGQTSDTSKPADSTGRSASPWSVLLVIAFMVIYTYLAFDLIMSLQPYWYSSLLGAHYAVGCFYLGIAGLVLVSSRRTEIAGEAGGNLTRLMFGISPFWISLLWSQYIVIWYGDMPEETHFVYLRFYQMPWTAITIVAIALAFVLPFVILMPRRAKFMGTLQFIGSLCAIVGLFVEKYMFVVPSFSSEKLVVGWIFPLVTIAFAVLFIASYRFGAPRMNRAADS